MSERINATCTICGRGYHMCLSCKDKMKLSPWKMYTDTAEHFKIHQIIHGFSTGVYNKDEVKNKLKNVDLSDLDTFKSNIKSIIKDVLKEEKTAETEIEIKTENKKVEDVEMVNAEDDVTVEEVKTVYSRKRNFKANNEIEDVE